MKFSNAVRMSLSILLLVTLPIFLTGCEALTTILAGLSKIFEGAKMIVDGIQKLIGGFGKRSKDGSNDTRTGEQKMADEALNQAIKTGDPSVNAPYIGGQGRIDPTDQSTKTLEAPAELPGVQPPK